MATRVTLETLDDQIVVQKVALNGDRADRRAEAVWLAEAHHEGVVRFLRLIEEPLTVITEHAGTDTLRTRKLEPRAAAAVLTQITTVLATLHERGLVHGKITLDHIVLHDGDRTSARLCSPRGDAIDPAEDLIALGECVTQLLERWDSTDTPVPDREVWTELAGRLNQEAGPYGMQRATSAFAGLSQTRSPKPAAESLASPRRHRFVGIGVAATFLCLCLAGLLALRPTSDASYPPLEVVIGTARFTTTANAGVVVEIAVQCPDGPKAAVLDKDAATLWGFFEGRDGEQAKALATVPGATNVELRQGPACEELWLTGPAGETRIVPAAR